MTSLAFVWVGTYAALGLWVPAAIPFAYQLASVASIYAFARTRRYRVFRASQLWLSLLLPFAPQWSLGGFENSSAVSLWAITSPLGALLFVGARQSVPWFAGLLLNVLPEPVAARLKESDGVIADADESVTVLFADIVGFTPLAEKLSAPDVVAPLHGVFARWDALAASHGVEKIETIGDAYMAAAGIPLPRSDHVEASAEMAPAMRATVGRPGTDYGVALEVRIGIDTGPVVAGVIGRAKFICDLWGDTVNTASRMESHAAPGTIQVTERAYEVLRGRFDLRRRGTVEIKGKGPMTTYLLVGWPEPGQDGSDHDAEVVDLDVERRAVVVLDLAPPPCGERLAARCAAAGFEPSTDNQAPGGPVGVLL